VRQVIFSTLSGVGLYPGDENHHQAVSRFVQAPVRWVDCPVGRVSGTLAESARTLPAN
jgi:hypothetical protein